MRIRRLEIVKLYGYMSRDITFGDRISLLVGINGSGKTTALNIINWLLKLNLEQLCTTKFDLLAIHIYLGSESVVIRCTQTDLGLTISVVRNDRSLPNIAVKLFAPTTVVAKDIKLREILRERYQSLGPEPHELETFSFIQSLPSPVVISLDRSLMTEESDGNYLEEGNRQGAPRRRRASESPLVRVRTLVAAAHNRFLSEKSKLNLALQQRIMLSAFEVYDPSSISSSQKIQAAQINQLEKKVGAFLGIEEDSAITGNGVTSQDQRRMKQYFSHLKEQVKGHRNRPELNERFGFWAETRFALFATQFHKIQGLISAFEQHEVASALAFRRLQKYLDTLQFFFSDCAKKVSLTDDGDLLFQVVDRNGETLETVSIDNLSSGERQVLILFTYIALNEDATVFIIDEPELSLHPRWQETFLSAVEELMSDKSQLVFATHSPALVGRHTTYCVPLLPYNQTNNGY